MARDADSHAACTWLNTWFLYGIVPLPQAGGEAAL
jgi:hypothetical protein